MNMARTNREDPFTGPTYEFWMSEDMGYILNEDIDTMNEIAPRGYYFGSSEGDGSTMVIGK